MRGIIAQKGRTAESNPPPGEYLSLKRQDGPCQFSATSAAVLGALGGEKDRSNVASGLLIFVFFMLLRLFVLVAPFPVFMLTPLIEAIVIYVGLVPLL